MLSNEFEQAFDDFLGGEDYDRAEDALFAVIRAAFLAGWNAAGGQPTGSINCFRSSEILTAAGIDFPAILFYNRSRI